MTHAVIVLVVALLACAPNVSMQSTRNTAIQGTIEPVAMIIYERNTGATYTRPLKEHLTQQLRKRRIPSRVEIITGAEFDESAVLKQAAKDARGIVFILPVGGTSYNGALTQILYEVSAFLITNQETGEIRKVWHARIDTNSGSALIDDRQELFAQELMARLVRDKVLPAHWSPKRQKARAKPGAKTISPPARRSSETAPVEQSDNADETDDDEADPGSDAE